MKEIIIEDCYCEDCKKVTPHILFLLKRKQFTVELRYICLDMYCAKAYNQHLPISLYVKLGRSK